MAKQYFAFGYSESISMKQKIKKDNGPITNPKVSHFPQTAFYGIIDVLRFVIALDPSDL